MAPTAQNLIDRALRLIGRLASGESPTAQESADALLALQHMLDTWQTERLLHPIELRATVSLDGSDTYTIGPSGADVTAVRPVSVLSAYVRDGDTDYQLSILTRDQYDGIADKAETSDRPAALYYDPTFSAGYGTLYVYPVGSSGTLYLQAQAWPIAYTALSSAPELPPGFADALVYSLAMTVAPEYGVQPSPVVVQGAAAAIQGIKTRNAARAPVRMNNDFTSGPSGGGNRVPEPGPFYVDIY